jgi:phosphatidylethanolamine-binding protein (PEBP) family uncharacterized protein
MKMKIKKTFRQKSRKRLRKTHKGGNTTKFTIKYNNTILQKNILTKLTIDDTKSQPNVFFIPENGKLYSIIMYDPDAPAKPSWAHWIVTNLSTPDMITYNTVLPYSGPHPPSGTHRYFFELHEQQSGKINPMISGIRGGFNYEEFIKENSLKLIEQIIMKVSTENVTSK